MRRSGRPPLLSLSLLPLLLVLLVFRAQAAPFNETWKDYNININTDPSALVLQFTSKLFGTNASYTPSPANWRTLPAYTVLLDKFYDGDPANNDFFETIFEYAPQDTQLRHGGDIKGLVTDRSLDYLDLMGIRVIYISGSLFLNMPWQADGYSSLDFTILDPHWGTVQDWADAIEKIHSRGMYIILDYTITTMADLIAMEGFEDKSAPFKVNEYNAVFREVPDLTYRPWGLLEYPDFKLSNATNDSCVFPVWWDSEGQIVNVDKAPGCKASEFDHYGDQNPDGLQPNWQIQLSKFAGVQDRLREWNGDVAKKIQTFPCLMIQALDIDGIRVDKAAQINVQFAADWSTSTRACAKTFNKNSFFLPGEISGGDTFGSLYFGRGRTQKQNKRTFDEAVAATPNNSEMFLREEGHAGYDSAGFHYSIYRSLLRLLHLDGELEIPFDLDTTDPAAAWSRMNQNEDLLNTETGKYDPRHWMGMTNHDIFRWPAIANGTQKQSLGHVVTMLLLPGIPLIYYGEEQGMYILDNSAPSYLFGRQAMTSSDAWTKHGCYKVGSVNYFNLDFDKASKGCEDAWNSLDHFDPTSPGFRYFQRVFQLRSSYPVLTDGFQVTLLSNQTYRILYPNSKEQQTEIGLRSHFRGILPSQRNESQFTPIGAAESVWFLWHNENKTTTYEAACGGGNDLDWVRSPYPAPVTVRNLFFPYETHNLTNSTSFMEGNAGPTRACLPSITLEPFGSRVFVPEDLWIPGPPVLTKFSPGHDARLLTIQGAANETTFPISLEYDQEMDCNDLSKKITINFLGDPGAATPTFAGTAATCGPLTDQDPPADLVGSPSSGWRWTRDIQGASDGIYEFVIGNITTAAAVRPQGSTGANARLLVRKGGLDNPVVFTTQADYSKSLLAGQQGSWTLVNVATGAQKLRYSGTYGLNWSDWKDYSPSFSIPDSTFDGKFWEAQHITVQYWSEVSGSAGPVVHGDSSDYSKGERRVPKFLARGQFNQFGFDQGIKSSFKLPVSSASGDGGQEWSLPINYRWPSTVQLNTFGFDDFFMGDYDNDTVLDRLPPTSSQHNDLSMVAPPRNKLTYTLLVNDKTLKWSLQPRGHTVVNILIFVLLLVIPPATALLTVSLFKARFYAIKINKYGVKPSKDSVGNEKKAAKLARGQKIIGWPEDKQKRRKMIIATLEYEILDWKIKVKIGGLGVMSKLMGTAMTDCDLIWVIPKVGDVEYPPGEATEPIEVVIFGESYLIEAEIHVYQNITYYILDSPVFRAQTKSDPYPARMDDLSSAVIYSTWNQCIAEVIRRNPIVDIYHINDYHGTLAPLYLLPKVFPTCLSLHNAEFQGLWPLRNKDEMNEVCAAFNLPEEVTTKYVQYGNTFNLLHAGASFIAAHQKSVGVAGVSDKYGKRSWARYPALWVLKQIDSLPNPDPDDIEALDKQVTDVKNVQIDEGAEAKRPGLKRQAQEWAKIDLNSKAQLFVFVGRWSKQKGVDIIADVFPALLEKNADIQLIAVGPVIDLYGSFAAEKLARLMEMYPKQVFSKPEFTALPPFLFSGADFALIPSRDEPFGLVAVEFGRKGALGVGARLGGLGLMPGWWFPVESTSTTHMISQLQRTIKLALKSTEQERAVLRARSAVQRFPVIEWRGRVEAFQKKAIRASRKGAGPHAYDYSDYVAPTAPAFDREFGDPSRIERNWTARPAMENPQAGYSREGAQPPIILEPYDPNANFDDDASRRYGYQDDRYRDDNSRQSFDDDYSRVPGEYQPITADFEGGDRRTSYENFLDRANRQIAQRAGNPRDPFFERNQPRNSLASDGALELPRPHTMHSSASSSSITSIVDEHGSSSPLNKASETFTDEGGEVSAKFVQDLKNLTSSNSSKELCIETYLETAEKSHFKDVKEKKVEDSKTSIYSGRDSIYTNDENLMPDVPLTRTQIFMGKQIGEWPLYTIVMSVGQLLSATAFQLVLLSGTATQKDLDLYVVGGVFFTASMIWWALFRLKPSAVAISFPWICFALAFFLIGLPSLHGPLIGVQTHITAAATWCYAAASAAGFIWFGMNFGEEAGATTESWIFRACVVQGLQQCWTAALWWWGSELITKGGQDYIAPIAIICITWPLAAISLVFFAALWWGLPPYYSQAPPTVPRFYETLFRRKIFRWFLVAEILRDYWLSPPYGRNYLYLWQNDLIPTWAIALMVLFFFVFVWIVLLFVLTRFAKVHSWLFAVIAIGLGAPRWCQIFWGTSGIGFNLPWAGKVGPYVGTSLWLWLGVLDNVQGVGLGMALLQTLSRFHVCAALFFCQCLGSVIVMIARASSPGRLGPSTIFPDFALWDVAIDGISSIPLRFPLFWVCLLSQITIVIGYLWLFRKEQLSKP